MDENKGVSGPDTLGQDDDVVAAFQLDARPVSGRVVRLGPVIDEILSAHDLPVPVAALLGEAVLLAVLIGDSLKFQGRLIVQASGANTNPGGLGGEGAVSFVVADYAVGEGVRGFARYDAERVAALQAEHGPRPGAERLLGSGAFAMTIDQGSDMDRYQGVVALDGPSLAACAEHYFAQSEQVPTRIRLAVGQEMLPGGDMRWRAGGAILQRIAGDDARGHDAHDFADAQVLFDTVEDDELLDPGVSSGRLLYRLFHEDGVRLQPGKPVVKRCTCERERLARILAGFPPEDRDEMVKDGAVVMTCEYCNRDWRFTEAEIDAAG
ncbi:HSP33-like chaperonin [Glycocaulis alkaliphilus]|uniref:HSP33-like chaperonin n=1 Tax=Glycocaulis alkaliphilus TaxID=1434191 RepID=A0A3T0E740_9PROT|nr:Hsp33 family molecular chaperone [Glycocaulis alkaliphilus]AZU03016.1 HSP33-like chaperonin [Glycocaulis alkaliphilus]GGB70338.1 33 kDa chaperonin [Glycocaulis alkaliphilus]